MTDPAPVTPAAPIQAAPPRQLLWCAACKKFMRASDAYVSDPMAMLSDGSTASFHGNCYDKDRVSLCTGVQIPREPLPKRTPHHENVNVYLGTDSDLPEPKGQRPRQMRRKKVDEKAETADETKE